MKRSWLINFILLGLLAVSCQNTQMNTSKDTVKDSADLPKTGTHGNDTLPADVSGSAPEKVTEKKDTAVSKKPKAIIHAAPDQECIDSIKEAKSRGKK